MKFAFTLSRKAIDRESTDARSKLPLGKTRYISNVRA